MTKKLSVEIWSDIACPWCYVGKRRLEAALARFPHAQDVEIEWHAFQLDPSAPAVREDDYVQRLATKYGRSKEQAQQMLDNMTATGAQEGLKLDFHKVRGGNTFLGHRLLALAKARGLQNALEERFFKAYFEEGQALGLPEVASKLAIEVGLDADEVTALVQGDQYTDEVRADLREAREIGVDGVPFFLLGRRYAVGGAQPAELLLQALEQTWNELPEKLEAEGPVCGPDGCA